MQAQDQKTEAAGPFVEFDGEEAKKAYLRAYAPKGIESLDMWERACIECGFVPPPTLEDFRAGVDYYPQLGEWHQRYMHEQLMEMLAAAFTPPEKPSLWKRFINRLLGRKPAEGPSISIAAKRISAKEMDELLNELEGPCECPGCIKAREAQEPAAETAQ